VEEIGPAHLAELTRGRRKSTCHPAATPTTELTVSRSQLSLAVAATTFWNHLRHPLYRFPGPFLASWSNVLHSYWFLGGRQPYEILALHEKYGPVVRTSPNELSFSSAGSWRDIYGFRQGHKPFVKSSFYDGGSFADRAHSIVSERDPIVHAQMRKYLSHAFSDRSLKEQEGLVAEAVNLFIRQLGVHASRPEGTDLVKWFNLTTFDIIGSLAFGEAFGGLTSGRYC
jgi:cytochrome P450